MNPTFESSPNSVIYVVQLVDPIDGTRSPFLHLSFQQILSFARDFEFSVHPDPFVLVAGVLPLSSDDDDLDLEEMFSSYTYLAVYQPLRRLSSYRAYALRGAYTRTVVEQDEVDAVLDAAICAAEPHSDSYLLEDESITEVSL